MRFVQVSDLHIVPRGHMLHRLDPEARLDACIADINRHRQHVGFCVFTGDLVDRGETEAYRLLRECLSRLELPYHLMLGNHDRRTPFFEVFPETPRDENGFLQFELETPAGVLIFLDTVDEGRNGGTYCERRCRWLSERLDAAATQPVYLLMHHPPFDIDIPSLDRMKLDDAAGFEAVIGGRSNIRHLFFGHVHRPVSGGWRGIPFSALPGTNHQIATDFETVSPMPYSHDPPAYAFVHLHAERTVVHLHGYLNNCPRRLPNGLRVPGNSVKREHP